MRDDRIVLGVHVLGDVEILVNVASRIGQKRPKWRPSKARLSRSFRVTTTTFWCRRSSVFLV